MSEVYSFPILILAGGLATRLRSHFSNLPKYCIPINGVPFALHQLKLLKKMGFHDIILCVGYQSEKIQKLLGDGSQLGLHIRYSQDGNEPLGTGGAIKKASEIVDSPFAVIYGDSYLEFDVNPVFKAYLSSQKKALLTIFKNNGQWDKSNIVIKDNEVKVYDKTTQSSDMHYIDYGFSIFSKTTFEDFTKSAFDLSDVIQKLIQEKQLAIYEVKERFYEVGTIEGIKELEAHL